RSVPVYTSALPLLVKMKLIKLSPLPADFLSVQPAGLFKSRHSFPTRRSSDLSDGMSNRPLLVIMAPLEPCREKFPLRLAPPLMVRVRAYSVWPLTVIARLPLVMVCTVPLMLPPVQVLAPATLKVLLPVRIPPL